jgi:hypothetical protein
MKEGGVFFYSSRKLNPEKKASSCTIIVLISLITVLFVEISLREIH